jgi:Fic family protein
MFSPTYKITARLLAHIKIVNTMVIELNHRRFPDLVLIDFENKAGEISTHASTSIEGNPLPLTEVKRILKNQPKNIHDTEREILNYNTALQHLKNQKESLTIPKILEIHKFVMDGLLLKSDCGKLRSRPVIVNDPRTGNPVYLPPDVDDVKPLMQELIKFVDSNQNTVDQLIMAGLFHKQMVIIHPFMDGNGRTTRLATKFLLANMGLNTFNLFSFENFYNQDVTRYFQMVGEYGNYYDLMEKIDFTAWLEYFAEGVVNELLRVRKLLDIYQPSPNYELQPHLLLILELIKKRGFTDDKEYSQKTNRAKATRALDFNKLINLGLIRRMEKARATYYILNQE